MSDFFVHLIESARRGPPSSRAVMPFEVDEEADAPQPPTTHAGSPPTPDPSAPPPRAAAPVAVPPPVRGRAAAPPARRGAREPVSREDAAHAPQEEPVVNPVPRPNAVAAASLPPTPSWRPRRGRAAVGTTASSPFPGESPRPSESPPALVHEQSEWLAPAAAEREPPPAARRSPAVMPRPGPPLRVPAVVTPPPVTEEVVHVSIGRIEVRATQSPSPDAVVPASPARPRLTLDEYLAERDRGRR